MKKINILHPHSLIELSKINKPEITLLAGKDEMDNSQYVDKYFFSDGTALGFYRDNDFIQNDTDIDIVVYADIDQTHIEFKSTNWKKCRITEFNNRPIQTAYVDNNGCIFDIYYYYPDIIENKYTTIGNGGKIALEKYNIIEYDTKYGKIKMPQEIESYLEKRYGDWKTPKQDKGLYVR